MAQNGLVVVNSNNSERVFVQQHAIVLISHFQTLDWVAYARYKRFFLLDQMPLDKDRLLAARKQVWTIRHKSERIYSMGVPVKRLDQRSPILLILATFGNFNEVDFSCDIPSSNLCSTLVDLDRSQVNLSFNLQQIVLLCTLLHQSLYE